MIKEDYQMDEYLEGLVKKTAPTEEVAEAVEEVKEVVAEPVDEVVAEPVETIEETVEPESTTEAVKEEVAEPEAPKVEVKKDEPKKPAKKEVEPKKEAKPKKPDVKLVVNREYDVKDLRVYNTPDIRQASKVISGRIVYLGQSQSETFTIIKYMRHGFGLVRGYAKDLELHLSKWS